MLKTTFLEQQKGIGNDHNQNRIRRENNRSERLAPFAEKIALEYEKDQKCEDFAKILAPLRKSLITKVNSLEMVPEVKGNSFIELDQKLLKMVFLSF